MNPTQDQIDRMVRIAIQENPNEACGIISIKGDVCQLPNRAQEPWNGFRLDPSEMPLKYLAVWHSHPDGSVEPSQSDQYSCRMVGKPYWIVSPTGKWVSLQPEECQDLALKGREFLHGVVDCYALIQDYSRQHF